MHDNEEPLPPMLAEHWFNQEWQRVVWYEFEYEFMYDDVYIVLEWRKP